MTTIWRVPVSPRNQKMTIDMGGISYTLHFGYNRVNQTWIMDINDETDTVPFCYGIPIVTGTDLMGQFRYLGIGGGLPMIAMTVGVGHSPDEIPTFENFGIDGNLFFKTPVP